MFGLLLIASIASSVDLQKNVNVYFETGFCVLRKLDVRILRPFAAWKPKITVVGND